MAMVDSGSSITLIFYKIGSDWYKGGEPLLNLIAAAAQGSVFTHIEIAIGEAPGDGGRMSNVLRVFNDSVRRHSNLKSADLISDACASPVNRSESKSQSEPVSTLATATFSWDAPNGRNSLCFNSHVCKLESRFRKLAWQDHYSGLANRTANLGTARNSSLHVFRWVD